MQQNYLVENLTRVSNPRQVVTNLKSTIYENHLPLSILINNLVQALKISYI